MGPCGPRVALLGCALAAGASAGADAASCFRPLERPLERPPFNDDEVAEMRRRLLGNLNYKGTGAVVASPGATPALSSIIGGPAAGYVFDWTRDGALAIAGLIRLSHTRVATAGGGPHLHEGTLDAVLQDYLRWVRRIVSKDGDLMPGGARVDAHGEGKWEISEVGPYKGHWCRPQTDGPPLRAQAVFAMMNRSSSLEERRRLWELAKFDLDWLLKSDNILKEACDLWEEETDSALFWNRMMMRSALSMGYYTATGMGDPLRARECHRILSLYIQNPVATHRVSRYDGVDFISECSVDAPVGGSCSRRGKHKDGAVILALVHSGLSDFKQLDAATLAPVYSPSAELVANTVRVHVEHWCDVFPINRDGQAPGVLLGRFENDEYGGHNGNPWVLITAALASLLYQGARSAAQGAALPSGALTAWRAALNAPAFRGTAADFIAQGDAVLTRLRMHVGGAPLHLYEQIDKKTGEQYNAKDLTWSYTEVLGALAERELAVNAEAARVTASSRRLHDALAPGADRPGGIFV